MVLPARYASVRLPGKLLMPLAGKPVIQHAWQQAIQSDASEVLIATDSEQIAEVAEGFGAQVVMTAKTHPSGTDRIAEVSRLRHWHDDDIIVNAQGDEPMLPPAVINQVAAVLALESACDMATLCTPMRSAEEIFDVNTVKVVCGQRGQALYFSRAPIPWSREGFAADGSLVAAKLSGVGAWQRHLGIYAYRAGLLQRFAAWPALPLERAEMLEQLRALEYGVGIALATACAEVPGGVDTEDDLLRLDASLKAMGKQIRGGQKVP